MLMEVDEARKMWEEQQEFIRRQGPNSIEKNLA